MKALALTICACAACGVDDPPADTATVTLPSDAWFGGADSNYASVDDCIAALDPTDPIGIWRCSFELVLCHSGRAGMLTGDIVSEGTYSMHQSVAIVNLATERQLYVDLAAGIGVDGEYPGMRWLPDVDHRWAHLEQFGFDCTQAPN